MGPPFDYLAFTLLAAVAAIAVARFAKLRKSAGAALGTTALLLAAGFFYIDAAERRETKEIESLLEALGPEAVRDHLGKINFDLAGIRDEAVRRARLTSMAVLAAVLAGMLTGLAAVARLRQAAEELERRNVELARARDAALTASQTKSRFLASVSHELRTPLHVFLGMNELLLQAPLEDRERRHAETARRAAEGLLGMVDDLLDYAQLEAGKLSSDQFVFDLADLVTAAADSQRPVAEAKGLALHADVDASAAVRILSDPRRVRQILRHLLANAIKFTEHGEVRILTRVQPGEQGGREVVVEVSDTGIGVPPDRQSEIFDSFSQVDPSTTRRYGGTGIGLALSRALADRLGGGLELVPRPGPGSTFRLIFPVRAFEGDAA
jgi:signal transduction histidine kinase